MHGDDKVANNSEYAEEEYDETLEVTEETEHCDGEFDETLVDFYDQGQDWNGTYVVFDVMESSTIWQFTSDGNDHQSS